MRKMGKMLSAAILAAMVAVAGFAGPIPVLAAEETTATVSLNSIANDYTGIDVTRTDDYTLLSIVEDGVYELTGEGFNVIVEIGEGKQVTLRLDNAKIDNSGLNAGKNDAAIYGNKDVSLTMELNGSSSLTGNPENKEQSDAIAMKKSENILTIQGSGSLAITGNDGDGISYKKGTVLIQSGTLSIKDIGGDGIQAENVSITGGTTTIVTAYENASTQYYTAGTSSVEGKNTIWEQNNGETKYERINVDTGSHKGLKVGTKAKTEVYLDGTESAVTEASGSLSISGGTLNIDTTGVGLKANFVSTTGYTAASNGVYIIGSPDDAISSNKDIFISGGVLNLSSSDDGISAAETLSITGNAKINIETSFEGMEGKNITVGTKGGNDSPTVIINSKDDGINAASKTLTYTYDSLENDDENYLKCSVRNKNNTCIFYSGSVTVKIDSANEKTVTLGQTTISYKASGDGIDCNGTLDIEGGEHFVFGQVSGDNSPIDTDDGFKLSKEATLFCAGGQGTGREAFPDSGTGVYVVYTEAGTANAQAAGSGGGTGGATPPDGMTPPDGGFTPPDGGPTLPDSGGSGFPGARNASFAADQTITVSDGSNDLFTQKLPYAATMIFYASDKLTSGTTYTLSTDQGSGSEEDPETKPDENPEDEEPPVVNEIEQIKSASVAFSSTTAKKKKIQLTIDGAAIEGAQYEIQYRKGNGAWKTVTTTDTSCVLKKLKRKKKYTLMVRLTKEIDGTTYTSAWSAETVVKTK